MSTEERTKVAVAHLAHGNPLVRHPHWRSLPQLRRRDGRRRQGAVARQEGGLPVPVTLDSRRYTLHPVVLLLYVSKLNYLKHKIDKQNSTKRNQNKKLMNVKRTKKLF